MLHTRFHRRGNEEDLDQAIALQMEALALHPVSHTDQSWFLNDLANQLSSRFEHRGNEEDLDQAITLHREVLALRLVGHTEQSSSLHNLVDQLFCCFEHQGNDKDLDQAIALQREALALHPAIALLREALALCPVSHTEQSKSLTNLVNQLSSCFEHIGNDEDLDQAIALYREVLALCPVSHTGQSLSLNNLAGRLATRFEHQGNREDPDKSRENLCCALTLLTQHDPGQSVVHHSLASVYLSFHRSGLDSTRVGKDTDSLNSAMHHLKATANVVSGSSLSRRRASLRWVHHASQHSHATELEACTSSMQLLDAYMSTTASVLSRHNIMKDFPGTLAVDAASCALHSGDTCSDHAVVLVKKFRDLRSLLNKPPVNNREATPKTDVEAEETRYRHLVKEWNEAVEEIRKIEGYSRFLLPPLFSNL
ncbi:hypothetical protein F4604DRAFT_1927118 [Suillus subluteus]|nr:hypothetical protein F4604DRAFT_1927118 [Suillus subluteus]